MSQNDLLAIANLYRLRFSTPRNSKNYESEKEWMTRRAKTVGVEGALANYINKYDAADMANIAVRKGEVGETAHSIFSYLTSRLNNKCQTSRDIYFQEPLEGVPNATLVQRQDAALELIATTVGGGSVLTGNEAAKKKVTMSHYNEGPLARLATADYRKNVIEVIEQTVLGDPIKATVALDSMNVFKLIQSYHSKLAEAQNIPKNPMRMMNYDKTAKGKVAILWYKQPKKDDDFGRMVHVYNALKANQVTTIILMGDKFDEKLPTINLRGGGSVVQNKDTGQSADDLLTITGSWQPKLVKYQVSDMNASIQNNLFYQWYAAYSLAMMCDAKYMVCPSRTGGSHGPFFLGLPLLYLDEYQSKNSFLQERMATFAVLDNYITPIPNSSLSLANLSNADQPYWLEGVPFAEAALIRFMQLYEDNLKMV